MDIIWKMRFEDLIHEVNGLLVPSVVRREELVKVIQSHLQDDIWDMYREVISQGLKPNTMIMTEELWYQLLNDPAFGGDSIEDEQTSI